MAIGDVEQKKKIETAMDLNVLMTVEHIAKKQNRDVEDVLSDFVSSETGRMLYDEPTKLWWSAAPEIAEMYFAEKES